MKWLAFYKQTFNMSSILLVRGHHNQLIVCQRYHDLFFLDWWRRLRRQSNDSSRITNVQNIILRIMITKLFILSETVRWKLMQKYMLPAAAFCISKPNNIHHKIPCESLLHTSSPYEPANPQSGPCLNIKTAFSRYRDSHAKDKTVARPSYLEHGYPYTGKI